MTSKTFTPPHCTIQITCATPEGDVMCPLCEERKRQLLTGYKAVDLLALPPDLELRDLARIVDILGGRLHASGSRELLFDVRPMTEPKPEPKPKGAQRRQAASHALCKGHRRYGLRCRNNPSKGSMYCRHHGPTPS